jgi:hypothetical protein
MQKQVPSPTIRDELAMEIARLKAAIRAQNDIVQELVRQKLFGDMPHAQQELQRLTRGLGSVTRRLGLEQRSL